MSLEGRIAADVDAAIARIVGDRSEETRLMRAVSTRGTGTSDNGAVRVTVGEDRLPVDIYVAPAWEDLTRSGPLDIGSAICQANAKALYMPTGASHVAPDVRRQSPRPSEGRPPDLDGLVTRLDALVARAADNRRALHSPAEYRTGEVRVGPVTVVASRGGSRTLSRRPSLLSAGTSPACHPSTLWRRARSWSFASSSTA
jgi:hypothetical protein